jgi:autotransporter-associated beta strand protein
MKTRIATVLLLTLPATAAPVALGPPQNPNNFNRTTFSTSTNVNGVQGFINYGINLNTQTYNIYLPSNYTPSGTYGLITYIDAGDAGTMPSVYQSVLDQHGLIFIAGTGIGNTVARSTRAGVAIMGSFRMCELHQIDRSRIYLMGNSGGGRLGMDVVYARPDWFGGFIGLSGTSFAGYIPGWAPPGRLQNESTADDYWPDDPEYYEVSQMYSYSTTGYRAPPAPVKVAFQAFHDDFRRTELVGTYRYAFMNHGAAVRLVYRNGGHSASNASAFDEAVRFMQHPYATVIRDRFEDANLATNTDAANTLERGTGFLNRSSDGGSASEVNYTYNSKTQKVLRLTAGGGTAAVEARNRFNWFNPHGIILDVKLRAETQAGDNQQIGIHIARGDSDNTPEDNPGLHIFRNHGGKNRIVLVRANGTGVELARWDDSGTHPMAMTTGDKLFWDSTVAPEFAGKTRDFRGEDVRVCADDNGMQLTFSRAVTGLETTFANGVILGSTARTVTSTTSPYFNQSDQEDHPILLQFLWDDMGLRSDVDALAFRHWKLLLSNRAFNPAAAAGDALVDEITLIAPTEEINFTAPVISTPGDLTANATSGQGAIVTFSPSAIAESGASLPVISVPPSGSGFPIGTTPVTCTATDAFGNTSTATFNVIVQANGFTPSPPGAPVAGTPAVGFGFVTLNWNAVPFANSYTIRRASSANGSYQVIASGITALTFTDSGRVNGVPLFYQITANNPTGESSPSVAVSATPVPGTAAKANNTINLDELSSWTTASVPGPADVALWDATVTTANTTTIGSGVNFSGIRIANPVGNVAIQPGSAGNLTLGSQGIDMSNTSSALTISADTVLSAAQTWHSGASTITASGDLTGSADLAKSGTGVLSLSGNNSGYSGDTTIKEGTLRYSGSTTNLPVLGSGRIHLGEPNGSASATLDFSITSSTSAANPLTISSGSGGRFIRSNMGNTAGHTLSGAITGSNNLTFAAGVITYSGASASTFTGNLFVTGGRLRLANGSTFNNATILSIASGASVDLNASGSSWNFAGLNDVSGAGGILNNAGGNRTINLRGGGSYAFSGNVQSNVRLVINLSGSGSQTLSGPTCNYTGGTTVTAGTLIVNGALTHAAAATVANGATLAGSGSIAAATTVSGTLAPGDGPGTLTFNGSLAMAATSKLQWQLPANATIGGDFLSAAAVTVTSGAKLDLLFNAPGSTVSFTDSFWHSNRSWPVLSSTALTGTLALGTISTDSAAHAATGHGVFSLIHANHNVTLNWTAYSARQRWNFLHFNTIAGNDSLDANNDGESNLLEFATGQNPHTTARASTTLIPTPNPMLQFTYTRSKAAFDEGYVFTVEYSDTLAPDSWISTGPGTTITEGFNQETSVLIPDHPNGRRFARLRITPP